MLGDPRYVPEKYTKPLIIYIQSGREPGSFLQSVLKNDLFEAIARADSLSLHIIDAILGWLSAYAPAPCWMSKENYEAWVKRGGMPNWTYHETT